jgi:hypothetical protein
MAPQVLCSLFAALAGPPLYLLRRNSELYFGRSEGLVTGTFYSIIDRSFYGRTYYPAQTQIVFAGAVATVAAFGVLVLVNWRRGKLSSMLPAICLMAIIATASLSELVQRFIFHTLYLADRTALFYVPLYVLFVTFLCEAIARSSHAGKKIVIPLLGAGLVLSAFHCVATANVTYASDWRVDASTKMMMEDLRRVVAAERPPGSRVVLGIEPR